MSEIRSWNPVQQFWSSARPKVIVDEPCDTCKGSGVDANGVDYGEPDTAFSGPLPHNEDGDPRCRDCGGIGRTYSFGLNSKYALPQKGAT